MQDLVSLSSPGPHVTEQGVEDVHSVQFPWTGRKEFRRKMEIEKIYGIALMPLKI